MYDDKLSSTALQCNPKTPSQTRTVAGADVAAKQAGKRNKQVILNCAPLTDYISKINIIQVDNARDLDVRMPMYSFIECCDYYSNTSRMSILQR